MGNSPIPARRTNGFTLIELSIVLVIIGLVAGGILVGRDLIRAAEIRGIVRNIESYKTAVHAFRGKYNCLPGDCPNATDFFGAIDPDFDTCVSGTSNGVLTCDGTGDGQIVGDPFFHIPFSRYWEMWHFWVQLSAAGLVTGRYTGHAGGCGLLCTLPGTNIPVLRNTNGRGGVEIATYTGVWGNAYILAAPDPNNSGRLRLPVFLSEDALQIDTKADDGLPLTGVLRAYLPGGYPDDCTTDTDPALSRYDLTNTDIGCAMLARAGF